MKISFEATNGEHHIRHCLTATWSNNLDAWICCASIWTLFWIFRSFVSIFFVDCGLQTYLSVKKPDDPITLLQCPSSQKNGRNDDCECVLSISMSVFQRCRQHGRNFVLERTKIRIFCIEKRTQVSFNSSLVEKYASVRIDAMHFFPTAYLAVRSHQNSNSCV
ncbi:hypothetical protein Plhal304r1_c060g0146591 [Plasmopara halstedii]